MADNPDFPISTASVSWVDNSGQVHIRVYSSDGYNITERCYDGNGWTTGYSCPGGNVSATAWADSAGEHIRVYATADDNTVEYCYDPGNSWYVGAYSKP